MHSNYKDIRDRIKEEPTWYDENGVPRYGEFHPDLSPCIYAHRVILMRIECQDCRKPFDVEMHWAIWNGHDLHGGGLPHYGDPPIHGCVGDTMNCDDISLLEAWAKIDFKWKRFKWPKQGGRKG